MRRHYGAPVTRRRVFILLVLRQLLLPCYMGSFQDFCDRMMEQLKEPAECAWSLGPSCLFECVCKLMSLVFLHVVVWSCLRHIWGQISFCPMMTLWFWLTLLEGNRRVKKNANSNFATFSGHVFALSVSPYFPKFHYGSPKHANAKAFQSSISPTEMDWYPQGMGEGTWNTSYSASFCMWV